MTYAFLTGADGQQVPACVRRKHVDGDGEGRLRCRAGNHQWCGRLCARGVLTRVIESTNENLRKRGRSTHLLGVVGDEFDHPTSPSFELCATAPRGHITQSVQDRWLWGRIGPGHQGRLPGDPIGAMRARAALRLPFLWRPLEGSLHEYQGCMEFSASWLRKADRRCRLRNGHSRPCSRKPGSRINVRRSRRLRGTTVPILGDWSRPAVRQSRLDLSCPSGPAFPP